LTKISHSSVPASWISLQSRENDTSRPTFVKNEIVKGVVLKSISLTSVMLLIKGKRIIANTHVLLSEGNAVTLKVEKTHPNPILKLMKIEGESVGTINTSMILNGIKKNLWKAIIEHMDRYPLPVKEKELLKELVIDISKRLFPKPNPDALTELIDKSGLGWEKKLRETVASKIHSHADIKRLLDGDLKGLISKIIASADGENHLLNQFISVIKNIQLLNLYGLEQDGKIFIPLPLNLSDGYYTVGQLLIQLGRYKNDEQKEKEKDNGFFRISFLLELSNLGPLRADLAVRGEQITGRFLTVKEETKSIIEKNLPSFIAALKNRGFSMLHLECHIKEPKLVNDTLIKEIIREESCHISLVA
jgi:hypothetical protein